VTVLFTERGAGDRSGTSWSRAKPRADLSAALTRARPGDSFLLGFPAGREAPSFWTTPTILGARGTARAPVRVEAGQIGAANAVIPLSAAAHAFVNPKRGGGSAPFRIAGGSAHLVLAGFHCNGAPADGFFKFQPGVHDGVRIRGLDASECGRVIETERGADIRGLVVEDCDAVGLVRGFARFRALNDSVLRNLVLDAALRDGGGENICQIIAIESGANIRIENVEMRRAVNLRGEAYAQGDGLVCEAKTRDVTIRNCHGAEMGDAAFDLKTVTVTLEDCTAQSCKFGMRIWSDARNVMRRCTVSGPRRVGPTSGACVECKGRVELSDCRLQAGAGAAIFKLDRRGEGAAPAAVTMRGGSIELGRDAVLVAGEAGVLELIDVSVNGRKQSRRVTAAG
jgi:hypothetical protein